MYIITWSNGTVPPRPILAPTGSGDFVQTLIKCPISQKVAVKVAVDSAPKRTQRIQNVPEVVKWGESRNRAKQRKSPRKLAFSRAFLQKAPPGLEPGHGGFAIRCLSHLATAPKKQNTQGTSSANSAQTYNPLPKQPRNPPTIYQKFQVWQEGTEKNSRFCRYYGRSNVCSFESREYLRRNFTPIILPSAHSRFRIFLFCPATEFPRCRRTIHCRHLKNNALCPNGR